MERDPLFIIVGGAYGVGKTTIAHQLSIDLHIPQRIALSGITKSIKALLPDSPVVKNWAAFNQADKHSIEEKLERESKLVGLVIDELVKSAYKDCKNHIVDGVQLLPEYLPLNKVMYFLITASDANRHKERFERPTITKTFRTEDTPFLRSQIVNQILIERWKPYGVPIIDNLVSPEEASRQIINHIKGVHPNYRSQFLWLEDKIDRIVSPAH